MESAVLIEGDVRFGGRRSFRREIFVFSERDVLSEGEVRFGEMRLFRREAFDLLQGAVRSEQICPVDVVVLNDGT